jgi:uncharacterized protein YhbP (UPF0306 family)
MSERHNTKALAILRHIKYATVATVSDNGQPWNSPVFTAYDSQFHFYWFSDKESQHSKNIRSTGTCFIVVYDSTAPEGTGEGVYIQATVRELLDDEVLEAKAICDARLGKTKNRDISTYTGDAPLRGYKATPVKVWINEDANNPDGSYLKDVRVEVVLS